MLDKNGHPTTDSQLTQGATNLAAAAKTGAEGSASAAKGGFSLLKLIKNIAKFVVGVPLAIGAVIVLSVGYGAATVADVAQTHFRKRKGSAQKTADHNPAAQSAREFFGGAIILALSGALSPYISGMKAVNDSIKTSVEDDGFIDNKLQEAKEPDEASKETAAQTQQTMEDLETEQNPTTNIGKTGDQEPATTSQSNTENDQGTDAGGGTSGGETAEDKRKREMQEAAARGAKKRSSPSNSAKSPTASLTGKTKKRSRS